MKRMGAFTLPRADRESEVRVNRKRCASTVGLTDLIATRTADTKESEATLPTRKPLITMSGGCIRKQMGDRNRQRRLNQPRTGLAANPAQITRPFKLALPVDAHWIAKGAEKDSATRTKGAEVGREDSRK